MEKRKTYSLAVDKSIEAGRHALNLSQDLDGKTISRQLILDALVECLNDKVVYEKVKTIIKSKIQ